MVNGRGDQTAEISGIRVSARSPDENKRRARSSPHILVLIWHWDKLGCMVRGIFPLPLTAMTRAFARRQDHDRCCRHSASQHPARSRFIGQDRR